MLPSDYEAHYLGDIVEEVDKAFAFIEDIPLAAFLTDERTIYAVEKAIQNAIEACIHIDNQKQNKGRFNRLFAKTDVKISDLRDIANAGRHDYGNIDARLVWNDLHGRLLTVKSEAVRLLSLKRR